MLIMVKRGSTMSRSMRLLVACAAALFAAACAPAERPAPPSVTTCPAGLTACDRAPGRYGILCHTLKLMGATKAKALLCDMRTPPPAIANRQWDHVLVDAPCTGTGTWRRNPEARWRLDPAELARLTALQARLLDVAAPLVRPGGRLVHVVCSLLDAEGADQISAFLRRHAGWQAVPLALGAGTPRGDGTRLTPHADQTDGFFVARLERL